MCLLSQIAAVPSPAGKLPTRCWVLPTLNGSTTCTAVKKNRFSEHSRTLLDVSDVYHDRSRHPPPPPPVYAAGGVGVGFDPRRLCSHDQPNQTKPLDEYHRVQSRQKKQLCAPFDIQTALKYRRLLFFPRETCPQFFLSFCFSSVTDLACMSGRVGRENTTTSAHANFESDAA